jgi:acyl-CoA thioesterase-1
MKLLFLLCLLLMSFALEAQNEPPTRVLCFGDSITEGSALPKEEKASLWTMLIEKKSNSKLRLINEGKGGRTFNSVGEFRDVLKKHEAFDVLLIALGTNDSRDITDKCVPNAVSNIKQMIDMALKDKPKLRLLLVGPPNINKNALGPTKPIANEREQKLKDLNESFKKLAQDTGCEFVSIFGVVPETSLLRDGVHPDAKGNEPIAETIYKALILEKKVAN